MLCWLVSSFGASQSLAVIGNQLPLLKGIPSIYLQIAPYVLTMVVLAAFFGQAVAPKADGLTTLNRNNAQREVGTKVLASQLFFGLSSKTQWLSGALLR